MNILKVFTVEVIEISDNFYTNVVAKNLEATKITRTDTSRFERDFFS